MRQAVVDAGALAQLVELLGSDKGKVAEQATRVLFNVASGSDSLRQAVVDAGALAGLVLLLGSSKGEEAELAARVTMSIATGPNGLK